MKAKSTKKKKKRTSLPVFILIALASVLMILYPPVSNYLSDQRVDGVIYDYDNAVQQSSEDEGDETLEKALQAAEDYNRMLLIGNAKLDAMEDDDLDKYTQKVMEILDLTGEGILGVVEMPRYDIYLPIYYGTIDVELRDGAGILEYSSIPIGGLGTHSVICAHSGMSGAKLFSNLPEVQEGDVFFIHILGKDLAYQVNQIKTVLPENVKDLEIELDHDYCTLLTCVPYGVNTHRLLVRGTRIAYTEDVKEVVENTVAEKKTGVWEEEYITSLAIGFTALAVISLLISIIMAIRYKKEKKKAVLSTPNNEVNQKGAEVIEEKNDT